MYYVFSADNSSSNTPAPMETEETSSSATGKSESENKVGESSTAEMYNIEYFLVCKFMYCYQYLSFTSMQTNRLVLLS